ncbi:N-lysine methyltransferase setd6-like, partial [Saccoglossus kowalevskii]|uniref:N-lysine methyltransferase setd6-like n=1 Tax=Saccoglossus kowalevskii TaxID=10224 RepID=A0ABM0MXH8_SACKO
VEVDISLMYESAKTIGHFNNIEKKWKWLKRQEIVEDSDKISIDRHGIHGLHMMAIIKVLLSDNKEFKTLKKDLIDESDDEDELAIATLSKDDLRQAPDTWQQLIYTMVEKQLETYNTSYEDNHELLKKDAFLTSRKRYSLHIRYGQQSILRNIAECCNNKANTKQNSGCKT